MSENNETKPTTGVRTSISGFDALSRLMGIPAPGTGTPAGGSAPASGSLASTAVSSIAGNLGEISGNNNKSQTNQPNGDDTTSQNLLSNPASPTPPAPATLAGTPGSNLDSNSSQKIVEEFQYLLEKSQQLFLGLRELSPIGGRQWQPYFQRTFEIYTKLWKFQQVHRTILESKDYYGLKRWEVGEIASKIGQLYYHYYLRTSETNYLHEAHIFYEAILDRAYFKDVLDAKNPAQMIKKLRYYARFIVVGLLLQRTQHVTKLLSELTALVEEYTKTFKPVDSMEWQMVLQEISAFLEAERKLVPFAVNTAQPLPIQSRLPSVRPVALESSKGTLLLGAVLADTKPKISNLRLQQAIIMGNTVQQLKFSELTLDMYRMVLTLEREISKSLPTAPKAITSPAEIDDPSSITHSLSEPRTKPNSLGLTAVSPRRTALPPPNKHMLFRPTLGQLLIYIANAYKEINENSALLVYLSAEGVKASPAESGAAIGYNGGCATSFRKPVDKDVVDSAAATHCLHPGDLVPFTRKPLFLIVDSSNSQAFKSIPRLFNQPLLCFMSPVSSPFRDSAKTGSLMTMFLYSPLVAFCHLADLTELTPEMWAQMSEMFHSLEDSIIEVLSSSSNVDVGVKRFLNDDFLRLLISRFILACMVISSHRLTKDPKNLPSSFPSFPEDIFTNPILITCLQSLVDLTSTGLIYSNLPPHISSNSPQPSTSTAPGFSPKQQPAPLEEKK